MKAFEIGAKATMVFYLHGLRGHAYAQKQALEHMVRHVGVSVISLELPGHGVDSVSEHCMVPAYTADDDDFKPSVAGFIGISSGFDVGHNVKPWKLRFNGLVAPISRFLFHNLRPLSRFVTIGEMDIDLISPDESLRQSMHDDDLVYKGRIPLYTSAQVYHAGLNAKQTINDLGFPVLLLHSSDDDIALVPSAEDFKGHVVLKLFKKLRHNCIDGLAREVVVSRKAITRFISDKL